MLGHDREDLDPLPVVWTDRDTPDTADLRFAHGLRIHLTIHDDDLAPMFWRWFVALIAAEAEAIFGVDQSGEVLAWQRSFGMT